MNAPQNSDAAAARTVMTVLAEYDVATKRNSKDVTALLQGMAISWGNQFEELREQHAKQEIELAEARVHASWLERRLMAARRMHLAASVISIVATTLIAFGVNFLTSESVTPGWVMLILGLLLEIISLGVTLVERDKPNS